MSKKRCDYKGKLGLILQFQPIGLGNLSNDILANFLVKLITCFE